MVEVFSQSFRYHAAGAYTDFVLLGPFPEGSVVERIRVQLYVDATSIVDFGVTLGITGQASQVAYVSGRSLIKSPGLIILGIPGVRWFFASAIAFGFDIECGGVVQVGSGWLVFMMGNSSPAAECQFVVAARVRREVKNEVVPEGAS